MHSKISLRSPSSLISKCRGLDLNLVLSPRLPHYIWCRKAENLEHTHGFSGAGKREEEGLQDCAGSAQGCGFRHPASQPQQRDALRGGGLSGLTGDPRFPGPPGPAAAEGPLALLPILHSFRKAVTTSIKRSSDASTTETGHSSRGRRGLRAGLTQKPGEVPHPEPLCTPGSDANPSSASEQLPLRGSRGRGWESAPTVMATVLPVLLERVLGPSPPRAPGAARPVLTQQGAGQPCRPGVHHRLPVVPAAQPSERKREKSLSRVRPCGPSHCSPPGSSTCGFSGQEGWTGLPSLQRWLSTVSSHLRVPLSADRACLPTSIGDMQQSRWSRRRVPPKASGLQHLTSAASRSVCSQLLLFTDSLK